MADTLPETNISPENRPLEEEIPNLETIIFRGELLVSGRVNGGENTKPLNHPLGGSSSSQVTAGGPKIGPGGWQMLL